VPFESRLFNAIVCCSIHAWSTQQQDSVHGVICHGHDLSFRSVSPPRTAATNDGGAISSLPLHSDDGYLVCLLLNNYN
jgi:hypothetical protein